MPFMKRIGPMVRFKFRNLGVGLEPGASDYRAYVGPPQDYDLVAAMCFNLLTCTGLRQYHRVLDIGCGSLRLGRLLIPYLNKGNYVGVEPNEWLVKDGIRNEIGEDLLSIKKPDLIYSDSIRGRRLGAINYAIAQSIFSHTKLQLFGSWLSDVSKVLRSDGVLFATIILGDKDEKVSGDWSGEGQWVYPNCVTITEQTVNEFAKRHKFEVQRLAHYHPRQTWFAFYRDGFNSKLFENGVVDWNRTAP
jgi:cyclopropane fatty-acyl-phospholipid synthase-like methyltransferase